MPNDGNNRSGFGSTDDAKHRDAAKKGSKVTAGKGTSRANTTGSQSNKTTSSPSKSR